MMDLVKRVLPDTVEERVEMVLRTELSPQKDRILRYLLSRPLAYTHQVAADCAVGYPPNRIGELNHEILPHYGLHIECVPPPKNLKNRFGGRTQVHRWRITRMY